MPGIERAYDIEYRFVRSALQLAGNNRSRAQCTSWLRTNCVPSAPLSKLPIIHAFTIKAKGQFGELPAVLQDLAAFLLTRGPFAWMGHHWCVCLQLRAAKSMQSTRAAAAA
eukprot:COSAG06_NODE_37769_length_431_cov_0.984940_1_plen_110_part_10